MLNSDVFYICAIYVVNIFLLLMIDAVIMNWLDDKRRAEKKNPRVRLVWARRWKFCDRIASFLIVISVVLPILWLFNKVVDVICKKIIGLVMNDA